MLEAALAYAVRGWPVYPVEVGGKRPLIKDWPNAASTDTNQLRSWWQRWPEANVAIVTGARSGVVSLDLDDDAVGGDNYGRLLLEHGAPGSAVRPDGAIIRTGRAGGGWRLLFALPPGAEVRKGTIAPGVEFAGDGGSAIMPPSRHPTGRLYVWREDPPDELPDLATAWVALMAPPRRVAPVVPTAPRPAEFIGGLGTAYGNAALRSELEGLASTEEGGRNETLYSAAFSIGSLAAAGHLDTERAIEELVRVALDIGLELPEIKATVRSGLEAGHRNPRAAA
jgi:putative DNA primase/helicase